MNIPPRQTLMTLMLFSAILMGANSYAGYATTKFPVVLVHGAGGAENILGVVPYWWGIPEKLKKYGNNQVYVATLGSTAGPEKRVPQLIALIDEIKQETGANKVHLIGHSQGGVTIRAFAAYYPERVASLTSIASPNHGSAAADIGWELVQGINDFAPELVEIGLFVVESLGFFHDALNGEILEQDVLPALYNATTFGSREFGKEVSPYGWSEDCNAPRDEYVSGQTQNIDGKNVEYSFPVYSWTGKGSPTNIFKSGEDFFDITAVGLSASYFAIKYLLGEGPNDGVVSTCSNRLGKVISEKYYWSHFDEVNHLFGLTPNPDPRSIFLAHMNRLQKRGL